MLSTSLVQSAIHQHYRNTADVQRWLKYKIIYGLSVDYCVKQCCVDAVL